MKLDVVYTLKDSEPNHDLRYSLRSLEKYGGEIGNVWIVGHCPSWVKNVIHLPTEQCNDKHISVRYNWETVCRCDLISDDFILMNDDFIITEPVQNWIDFTNLNMGTLDEKAKRLEKEDMLGSKWLKGFRFNRELLLKMGVPFEPLNFEYHGAMIINRYKRLEMIKRPELRKHLHISNPLYFQRSVYGNLYGRQDGKKIHDSKFVEDVQDYSRLTENGFFSVGDNMIGYPENYPFINAWLNAEFPYKSSYEKLVE